MEDQENDTGTVLSNLSDMFDQTADFLTAHAVLIGTLAAIVAIAGGVFAGIRFLLSKKPGSAAVPEEFATKVIEQAEERARELKAELASLRADNESLKDKTRDAELIRIELSAIQARLIDRDKAVEEYRAAADRIANELSGARGEEGNEVDLDLDAALEAVKRGDFDEAKGRLETLSGRETDVAAIDRQARIAFSLGTIAEQEIDYSAAKEHYLRAHELDPEDLDALLACAWLARLAGDVSLSAHAADRLRGLIDVDASGFDNEPEREAEIFNAIGLSLNQRADFQAAQSYLDSSLEISQRVLGEEHPDTASSYNNVGANLNAQGRYEAAEPLYRKGLEIRQRVLGEEHPDTASSYNNVGSNLYAQGRYEDAEPLFRKGLEIRQRVLGEEHPDTATSYNNVASNLNAQGRYEVAEPLYRKGLEIRQRVLGEEHPSTSSSYNNVAYNLNAQGRYEESETHYRKAVEIMCRVLGPGHPNTKVVFGNLVQFLTERGRAGEIEALRAEYPGIDE